MTIKKNTPNYLKLSGLSFTTILNEMMNLIPDDGALGIYCYLSSKPENWNICTAHLMNRFNKGRDYIKKKMDILKNLGLVLTMAIKDEKGKILHWETTLFNHINIQNTENPYCGKSYPQSTILKTQNLEKPESGKTVTSNKRILQRKEEAKNKREPARKKRVPLPDFFVFNEAHLKLCNERKLSARMVFEKFALWMKSKSILAADWDAEAMLWIMKEKQEVAKSPNFTSEPRSTIQDYGPGHPTWETLHGKNAIVRAHSKETKHGSEVDRDYTRRDSVRKAADFVF